MAKTATSPSIRRAEAPIDKVAVSAYTIPTDFLESDGTLEWQRALDQERVNLGAAKVPREVDPQTRLKLRRAIDESFVSGFRRVMLIAAALALLSGLVAWVLIQGKRIAEGRYMLREATPRRARPRSVASRSKASD
jgi:hypothetical protein